MINDKIQYTDKFDILTYVEGTNSVVVLNKKPQPCFNILLIRMSDSYRQP